MKQVKTVHPDDFETEPVTLVPEDQEDMWHIYNLIMPGDTIRAHAIRKVTITGASNNATTRVHTELVIKAVSTFYDPLVSELQVKGRVTVLNPHLSLGQYHTLDLTISRPFTIAKPNGWDSVAGMALTEALKDDRHDSTAAVVLQDGQASICIINNNRTVLKARVELAMPGKRAKTATHDNSRKQFFEKTLSTLQRNVDLSQPRPLLLASPGFIAADFREYIAVQGRDKSDKTLSAIAKTAFVVHTNSGNVHALNEVLMNKGVRSQLKDMRMTREAHLLDELFKRLHDDDGRAWYGRSAVERAVNDGAVGPGGGTLVLSNSLFRSDDLGLRKQYVAMVDKAKASGGEIRIISGDHESGRKLDLMGGIAAILTYPMYDLDEEQSEQGAALEQGEIII